MPKIKVTCKAAELRDIKDLDSFQGNLKELSKVDFEKLKKSIIEHGFSFPVFVWKKFIINGHQRVEVVKWLLKNGYTLQDENGNGTTKVPVAIIYAKNKKEAARKLLLENSHFASMTEDGLYEFMSGFDLKVDDLKDFRLPDIDLDHFEAGYFDSPDSEKDNEVPEVPKKAVTKKGDLYQLGKHRLLCGDATSEKDVSKLMNDKKADMVFTDPPYGLGGYGGRNKMRLIGDDQDVKPYYRAIPNLAEVYVWGRIFNLVDINFIPRDIIIWRKNNFGLGRGYRGQYEVCFCKGNFNGSDSDVWDISKDVDYKHPTQKPTELCCRAIKNSNPSLVLDLFLGSGSTLIACEKTNRICYGMEIDPLYCDVIVKRYVVFSGNKNIIKNGKKILWKT